MLKNIFLLLFVIILGLLTVECKGNKTKNENHLSKVSTSLSTLSRFITGLSVQWTFMRSSDRFQPILSDLLLISNATVLPRMLNLDVKKLSNVTDKVISVIKKTELEENLNISKIRETIETFEKVDLERLEKAMDLPDLQNFTSFSAALRKQFTDNLSIITDNTSNMKASIAVLKTMVNKAIVSYTSTDDDLKTLSGSYPSVKSIFNAIKDISDKKLIDDFLSLNNGTDKTLEYLNIICEEAVLYNTQKLSNGTFSPLLSQIDKLKTLITGNRKINKSIGEEFQDLANHLLSPDANDKESIDLIFKDLKTDEWLRSLIDYKKSGSTTRLIRALSPLQNFLELLKPVQKAWKVIRDKEMITNLERFGGILEFQEIDELKKRMKRSIACVKEMKVISDMTVITEFQTFYKGFEKVKEELKKFHEVIKEITSDENLGAVISNPFAYINDKKNTGNKSEIEFWEDQVSSEFDRVKSLFKEDHLSLIRKFADKMETINTALLLEPKSFLDQTNVDRIPGILNSTSLITGLTCLQNISTDNESDNNFITKFQNFLGTLSTFKNDTHSGDDIKTFLNSTATLISRTDKLRKGSVIKMLSHSPEENKILMMKVADRVALGLSAGTRVIRDIAKLWSHRDKLQEILNTTIDKEIEEIYGNWTDKNRRLIDQLISNVISLNEEAEEMKSSSDPMDVFDVFELALNISGAPINSSSLSGVIFKGINSSKDPEVSKFADRFKDFPELKLNFSNDKVDLESAMEAQELINEFLDDFSGVGDKDGPPLIATDFYMGMAIVGVVLLISMSACAFVLYSGKKDGRQ